jgi:DNA-binding MarR family transcriptional regulator
MESPEPCWLDADEQQTWLALASALIRLPAALDAQLQRDAGISHFEYQVLSVLSMRPERTLRMSVLALLAGGSLPRLSQVVGRLEKRGWLRRTPDPADGRYTLAILTDAGRAKLIRSAPGHVETVRRLVFSPLTKSQARQLRDISRRIVRAIDPDDPCLTDQPPATVTQRDTRPPRVARRSRPGAA